MSTFMKKSLYLVKEEDPVEDLKKKKIFEKDIIIIDRTTKQIYCSGLP